MQKNNKNRNPIVSVLVLIAFAVGIACGYYAKTRISYYCDNLACMQFISHAADERKTEDNLIGYISYLNRALALCPDDFYYYPIYIDLADAYQQLGEYKYAISCYNTVLENPAISSKKKEKIEGEMFKLTQLVERESKMKSVKTNSKKESFDSD
ncbi:tetratricopeptide repeat protein [bacterium]|nr:tetratricopeptide repeat protein [bacterium]